MVVKTNRVSKASRKKGGAKDAREGKIGLANGAGKDQKRVKFQLPERKDVVNPSDFAIEDLRNVFRSSKPRVKRTPRILVDRTNEALDRTNEAGNWLTTGENDLAKVFKRNKTTFDVGLPSLKLRKARKVTVAVNGPLANIDDDLQQLQEQRSKASKQRKGAVPPASFLAVSDEPKNSDKSAIVPPPTTNEVTLATTGEDAPKVANKRNNRSFKKVPQKETQQNDVAPTIIAFTPSKARSPAVSTSPATVANTATDSTPVSNTAAAPPPVSAPPKSEKHNHPNQAIAQDIPRTRRTTSSTPQEQDASDKILELAAKFVNVTITTKYGSYNINKYQECDRNTRQTLKNRQLKSLFPGPDPFNLLNG